MDAVERYHYKTRVENQYLKAKRTDFQSLMCEILEGVYPNEFTRVRLAQGDHQLDGFKSDGTVFACYAPRDTTWTESETKQKVFDDFDGAKNFLASNGIALTKWVFIHNDPDGLTAAVVAAIHALRQAQPNVEIEHWGFEAIWGLVQALPTEKLQQLFGPGPSEAMLQSLGFASIQPVLEYVHAERVPLNPSLEAPDSQKLEFNSLPLEEAEYLRWGRIRASLVGKYISTQVDPARGEEIAQACRSRYAELRQQGLPPKTIFSQMHEFIGGVYFQDLERLAAVCAVLAYFFDSCDIFENPPGDDSSN